MLSEAKQFWDAISGKIKSLIQQETANTFRCERYEVTTAPNGTVIGVTKAFGEREILLPYSKEVESATVGQPVLVVWWGSMSNAKVYYYANGYDGASGGGGGGNEIYIGTDTPPAAAKVWINPNGDPDSIGNEDLYRGNKVSSGNITLADEYTNYDLLVITWITNVDVYTQILDTKGIVSTRNYFTDFAATNAVNGLLSTAYIKFPNTTTVNIAQVTYNNVNWSLGILSIVGVTVSNPDLSVLKVRNPTTALWDAVPAIQGAPGAGVPTGGTTGQVLTKNGSSDYDAIWTNDVYSASETLTDKVWINGSAIYRLVVDCGSFTSNQTKTINTGVTGITQVISIYAVGKDANNYFPIPYSYSTSVLGFVYYAAGTNQLVIKTGPASTVTYAILEYTK